jgi:hypothetical protein
VIRETLRGGDVRLSGKASAFVYQRLRPGVLLTATRGRDTGEFGTAPLDLIEREYGLFGRPVRWYLDATQAKNAAGTVVEQWTDWLVKHEEHLAQMHVLTGSKEVHLMIEIARHFSDASQRMILYKERAEWTKSIQNSEPGMTEVPDPAARWDEPAIPIFRELTPEKCVEISASGCRWSFRMIANEVVFSTFSGNDYGDLTDAALDEMERLIARSERKVSWFLDLRNAQNIAPKVSQTWTEWLSARQARFDRIIAVAPSPLFPLVLTIAKYRSGTEHMVRIHRELGPFRNDVVSATSSAVADAMDIHN